MTCQQEPTCWQALRGNAMGTLFVGGGLVMGGTLVAFCVVMLLVRLFDNEPRKPKDYHIRPNLEQYTERD